MRLLGWHRWSALVVTLFCAGMLVAQEEKKEGEKRRRDRGDQKGEKGERRSEKGRGGFGIRGGQGQINMLENADVQKELQLTNDQKASLPLLKEEFKEADEKFGESMRDQSISREDRMAKITERNKEIDKQIGELLATNTNDSQVQLQAGGIQRCSARKPVKSLKSLTNSARRFATCNVIRSRKWASTSNRPATIRTLAQRQWKNSAPNKKPRSWTC